MEPERNMLKIPLGFRSKIPSPDPGEVFTNINVPKTLQNITPCVRKTRTTAY